MTTEEINQLVADFAKKYAPLISYDDAAEIADIPKDSIYDWSSRGLLDSFKSKCGRHCRLSLRGFVAFLYNPKPNSRS